MFVLTGLPAFLVSLSPSALPLALPLSLSLSLSLSLYLSLRPAPPCTLAQIGGINTGLIRDVGGPFKLLPEPVVKALAWLAETLLATSAGAIAAHFHRRGIPTFFLGVNDEKTLQGAAKAGAHAMLTDRPEWFSQQIKKSGAKLFRPVVRPR